MRSFIVALAIFLTAVCCPAARAATEDAAPIQDRPHVTAVPDGFLNSPAKGLAGIYADFHDWKVDSGIGRAQAALDAVDGLYERDPEAALSDKSLRLNKAFQIKSTLHTLLGMLYYRKSLLVLREGRSDAEQELLDKIEKGQEVSEADLERVATEAEKGTSARLVKDNLVARAIDEFKRASEVDPSNPSPHYQMAAIYGAMASLPEPGLAEAEYFRGAELSIKEGQKEAARSALESIRGLNPSSKYLPRLESLLAR